MEPPHPRQPPHLRLVGHDLQARRVVHLLVLPHRQHHRSDATGQGELGQIRLDAGLEPTVVVRVKRMADELGDNGGSGTLEDRFEHRLTLARETARLLNICTHPLPAPVRDSIRG